jgi:hypothetical protein
MRGYENPSIGVLLCRTKDDQVVEYAMSRHLSPALVAQYEIQMIPKAVLQQKLHEWSLMLQAPDSLIGIFTQHPTNLAGQIQIIPIPWAMDGVGEISRAEVFETSALSCGLSLFMSSVKRVAPLLARETETYAKREFSKSG